MGAVATAWPCNLTSLSPCSVLGQHHRWRLLMCSGLCSCCVSCFCFVTVTPDLVP